MLCKGWTAVGYLRVFALLQCLHVLFELGEPPTPPLDRGLQLQFKHLLCNKTLFFFFWTQTAVCFRSSISQHILSSFCLHPKPSPGQKSVFVSVSGSDSTNNTVYCIWNGRQWCWCSENSGVLLKLGSLCFCELIQWLEQQGTNRTKTMRSVIQFSRGLHMDPSPPILLLQRITTSFHKTT